MRIEYSKWSRVLNGSMGLGRSRIYSDTLAVDGGAMPDSMVLDARGGNVYWLDQENLGDPGPYLFAFEHFRPAQCTFGADKPQIAADGVEEVVITVTCEDMAETMLPMSVYCGDELIGMIDVALTAGAGTHIVTSEVAGKYRFAVDTGVADADWLTSRFRAAAMAVVEAT